MSHWRELLDAPGLLARFWSKVTMTEGCWEWTAADDGQGYGFFYVGVSNGQRVIRRAHQVAWEATVGPLTPGLVIDHLCRNRRCVNVLHLEEVSNAENIRRSPIMRPGARERSYDYEFCKKGIHRMSETAMPTASGARLCRPCRREYMREWNRKQEAVA